MIPLRLVAAAALSLAGNAHADPVAVRLTPAEIQAALAEGDRRNLAAEALALTDKGPGRKIHGEITAGIGTGGYRSYGGTVVAPLGDTGTAAFSYNNTDFGRNYGYGSGYYAGGGFGRSRRNY